jgi:monoamine oxidase
MHVIIIGAGAAGLYAAKKLSEQNIRVSLVEARDRTGGRINTINQPATFEAGAEFIHGNLEVTMQLMKAAGLKPKRMEGKWWTAEKGNWVQNENLIENEKELLQALENLKHDETLEAFLNTRFGDPQYTSMREALRAFVEGYHAADIRYASAKAFLKDWQQADEEQFRVPNGYSVLLSFLLDVALKNDAALYLNTAVKKVIWEKGKATVYGENDITLSADKVLFTIPLGVWKLKPGDKGAIQLQPALPEKIKAFGKLGFGSAIKLNLLFKRAFWNDKEVLNKITPGIYPLSFLLSDEEVPTWWTQFPDDSFVLTGWIAGPKAAAIEFADENFVLKQAINSLSALFRLPEKEIEDQLLYSHITNWFTDPYARGSYSYSTVDTKRELQQAAAPVDQTLFFAGEALNDDVELGTVEAAFASVEKVIKKITG